MNLIFYVRIKNEENTIHKRVDPNIVKNRLPKRLTKGSDLTFKTLTMSTSKEIRFHIHK